MNVKKQSVFYVILNILQGMKLEILNLNREKCLEIVLTIPRDGGPFNLMDLFENYFND